MIQALSLTSDLKLGHYMHIPPLAMIGAQFIGTLIGVVMNTIFAFLMMDTMLPVLQAASEQWTPASYGVFINAGSIWGSIGPARFFGIGSPYVSLLSGFPIGLALPLIPWVANKYFPNRWWQYVNFPLITSFNLTSNNLGQIIPNLVLGFIFNHLLFKYRHGWWSKYNYTLSIGLDTGTALATLAVSFLIFGGISFPNYLLNPESTPDFYCFQ